MVTESIKALPAPAVATSFVGDLVRATMAIANGWRAARDYRHLIAANRNAAPQQVIRAVFEHHFA